MEESVGGDRLSELPEPLIDHILSFLPIRDVVSTTLLSKRWKNLWTLTPCLNFSNMISEEEVIDGDRIRNLVNRALIFWRGSKLLKFTIEIGDHFDKSSLGGDMDLWLRFAVESKVEELNILLSYVIDVEFDWEDDAVLLGSKKDLYWAPQCLNSCSSVRKLSLVGCNLRIPGFPVWNQLKCLRIDGFYFSERLINRIMLGAPQLEEFELRLHENNENLNIRSTSLKKLKIEKHIFNWHDQPSLDTVLKICCPNLETLKISGIPYSAYLFTTLSSLTEVTLVFYLPRFHDTLETKLVEETMRLIFSAFQRVERLALSSSSLKVFRESQKKNLFSPLPSVVFLKVEVDSFELTEMVNLLEVFPNLKMLVIVDDISSSPSDINAKNCLGFKTNLCQSFLLQLKIVEITLRFCNSSIFRCIEFLLKHGSMLEKLVIRTDRIWPHSQKKLLEVAETVLSMPRSSPTAKVIFKKECHCQDCHSSPLYQSVI